VEFDGCIYSSITWLVVSFVVDLPFDFFFFLTIVSFIGVFAWHLEAAMSELLPQHPQSIAQLLLCLRANSLKLVVNAENEWPARQEVCVVVLSSMFYRI
jgi:hypothetical protein